MIKRVVNMPISEQGPKRFPYNNNNCWENTIDH